VALGKAGQRKVWQVWQGALGFVPYRLGKAGWARVVQV
jgi:hypothetical protein